MSARTHMQTMCVAPWNQSSALATDFKHSLWPMHLLMEPGKILGWVLGVLLGTLFQPRLWKQHAIEICSLTAESGSLALTFTSGWVAGRECSSGRAQGRSRVPAERCSSAAALHARSLTASERPFQSKLQTLQILTHWFRDRMSCSPG